MIHKIFTVFDVKARAYLPPFFLPEQGMAIRVFSDCINAKDHQFNKHPEDYTLFTLGTFDDSLAEISEIPAQSIHNGIELLRDNNDGETQQVSNDPPILTSAEG
ncbi:hypothetical protein N9937_02220 [bacterium]|nr:hypothetical protein [bacterium]